MTQEDKELLLKDLCARLPYGVKIQVYYEEISGSGCFDDTVWTVDNDEPFHVNDRWIENIRPYLFPLSSMTEEQYTYRESLMEEIEVPFWGVISVPTHEYYDYLNKNHFDYRGLISMGLAIDCTNLNIY